MKALLLAAIVALGIGANCAGCPPIPTRPDADPIATPDAQMASVDAPATSTDTTVVVVDAKALVKDAIAPKTPCEVYCQKLADLKCPEGIKYGVPTCTTLCNQVLSTGFAQLNLACVQTASTQETIRSVCRIKCAE